MKIQNVQSRADGGFYATIDGRELEFIAADEPSDGNVCDHCQRGTARDESGDCIRDVLGDLNGTVMICTDCARHANSGTAAREG